MDDPANPTIVNEPPWHVGDEKPPSPDSPRGGADASLDGSAEPLVSGPEPSAPSAVPPIPEWEIPKPSELPPIPEPIVPSSEIPVPQTPGETSLPPLPPPPFPTGGSETPFVIGPASAATTIKPPKKGGGGKVVLASLIFFLIAITTGVGFYFFQKGGLPFNLGKKAAPGACCTYGGSPTGCAAGEECISVPADQAPGCIYPYVCRTKVTTWATQNCADIWYNGGYGNIPSDAQCCCRIVNPGPPCDEDCRFANEASYNSSMGTVIQFCDAGGSPWRPSWQSRNNTDCDEKGYCQGIDNPLISSGTCSVCNNKWRKPPVTPTPTPPKLTGTPTPTPPKLTGTPTPTPPKLTGTPTPTPTTTTTPTPTPTPPTLLTPPPPLCSTVEAYKKGTTGLDNIVPGDTIVIAVVSTADVTDMAVRIRVNGSTATEQVRFSSTSGTWIEMGRRWQVEYTIPTGGVGDYTIDGFVKAGGVWR